MSSRPIYYLITACSLLAVLFVGHGPAQAGEDCDAEYSSTFALIEKVVFENRGCNSQACHSGPAPAGGLDLSPGIAWENLIDQPSQTPPGYRRVVPGQKDESLLWQNLAAATLPDMWDAPLRPMPLGGIAPLSLDELEAVRLWIEGGAPRDGTVPGTAELLDACLPPAEPIQIEPLPPPAAGEGVQIHMPRWILPAQSENEVCYASYFDVSDQVPMEFRGPNGDTFRYKRNQVRQDPLSHHLIVNLYEGDASPDDLVWGPFECRGGDKDGEACEPTDLGFCGAGSGCTNDPSPALACIGARNQPDDAGIGINSAGLTGTQETASETVYAQGVYGEAPLRGMIIWNSHAFNLSDQPGKVEAWLNFDFAAPEEQQYPLQGIFNTSAIFNTNLAPFETQEICNHHVFTAPRTRLFELNSHTHRRGKRWRTFLGEFSCNGTPGGKACSPFGPDLASPDICAGAPCVSRMPPAGGDCNGDLQVKVDELVMAVAIALGTEPLFRCRRADQNHDQTISVYEIVGGVNAANSEGYRDPEESLLYTSTEYSDPLTLQFDPPMIFPGENSVRAERTLTYCSLYDNGFTNPDEVKRRSTSPRNCNPTHCAEGVIGRPCGGSSDHVACDSSPGSGDGLCDACRVTGGVTTEDEMFLLLGNFFVQ